jgi:hypothetical protein
MALSLGASALRRELLPLAALLLLAGGGAAFLVG